MNFDMGILTILSMLLVVGAICGMALFIILRHSKDTQRQSALILKAMVKNTENIHSFDKRLSTLNSINTQSLQFQQKAFEHQRMLVMSMNQQLKSITSMMGNGSGNQNTRTNQVPLNSGNASNTFQKKRALGVSPKQINFQGKGVMKLEDLLRPADKAEADVEKSSDLLTENAVKMPVQNTSFENRRVANG